MMMACFSLNYASRDVQGKILLVISLSLPLSLYCVCSMMPTFHEFSNCYYTRAPLVIMSHNNTSQRITQKRFMRDKASVTKRCAPLSGSIVKLFCCVINCLVANKSDKVKWAVSSSHNSRRAKTCVFSVKKIKLVAAAFSAAAAL